MLTRYLVSAAMFAVGVTGAMQPPINAALARRTGSFEAATVSFAVGTLALLAVALVAGGGSLTAVRGAPWWQLAGGFIGALFVWSAIVLVPRVGTTALLAGIIAGQLTGGVLIDRFGWFGVAQMGVSWYRALGIFLLVVGGMLVLRR